MSDIIRAAKELLDGKEEALQLVNEIVNSTNVGEDFPNEKDVHNFQEIILGYEVHYGLCKIKEALADGTAINKLMVSLYGVFEPISGKLLTDQVKLMEIKDEILAIQEKK